MALVRSRQSRADGPLEGLPLFLPALTTTGGRPRGDRGAKDLLRRGGAADGDSTATSPLRANPAAKTSGYPISMLPPDPAGTPDTNKKQPEHGREKKKNAREAGEWELKDLPGRLLFGETWFVTGSLFRGTANAVVEQLLCSRRKKTPPSGPDNTKQKRQPMSRSCMQQVYRRREERRREKNGTWENGSDCQ